MKSFSIGVEEDMEHLRQSHLALWRWNLKQFSKSASLIIANTEVENLIIFKQPHLRPRLSITEETDGKKYAANEQIGKEE